MCGSPPHELRINQAPTARRAVQTRSEAVARAASWLGLPPPMNSRTSKRSGRPSIRSVAARSTAHVPTVAKSASAENRLAEDVESFFSAADQFQSRQIDEDEQWVELARTKVQVPMSAFVLLIFIAILVPTVVIILHAIGS